MVSHSSVPPHLAKQNPVGRCRLRTYTQLQKESLHLTRRRVSHGILHIGCIGWNGPRGGKVPNRLGQVVQGHGGEQPMIDMGALGRVAQDFDQNPSRTGQGERRTNFG